LVFLLAVPPTDAARYLHLLSTLAGFAEQPEALAELEAAPDAPAMLAVLQRIELRQVSARNGRLGELHSASAKLG
jgi:mannitol/fructose-specific phosphotransferase system IIA component (Ntr-type)